MPIIKKEILTSNKAIFALLWLLTFLLYLSDVKAGWVIDSVGWLHHVKHDDFIYYLNRPWSQVESLYQFTQFITWVFYKLWGANVWLWSLLYITLHAVNAWLLFVVCRSLFKDSGIKQSTLIPLTGVLLFTCSPYISEVIIWKACYHYLQGFLFLLLIIRAIQLYHHAVKSKFIILAGLVFLLSSFSLEIFYTTPFFTIAFALYYRLALGYDKRIFNKVMRYFLLPQAVIFGIYFGLMRLVYHHIQPHVYNVFTQSLQTYLSKPIRYVFHLLCFGRFFPMYIKDKVYDLTVLPVTLIVFYGIVVLLTTFLIKKARSGNSICRLLLLLFSCVVITVAILMPLPFPGPELLVFYDSYSYFTAGFTYILLSFLFWQFLGKYIFWSVVTVFAGIGLYFTITLNVYWKQSAYIDNRLLTSLPEANNKITILLNLPQCMNGVPMIGSDPQSEYQQMRKILYGNTSKLTIYDAASYNMLTPKDAAHVTVLNDSMLRITLNQWGTWWFYEGHGGHNYETPDYKMNMTNVGHEYEITLKHPATQYQLLYQTDCNWHIVDWNKKGVEQE